MRTGTKTLALILALSLSASAPAAPGTENTPGTAPSSSEKGSTYLLAAGRGLVVDPEKMQQLAADSVNLVAESAVAGAPDIETEELTEPVMTRDQVRAGERTPRFSSTLFKERLAALSRRVTAKDTVLIYTHTHGRKANFESTQPLGGLVLDLPKFKPEHRGTTLWDEYAEMILAIPARNVIITTMSCFSGGLVDYLERPEIAPRWNKRKKNGRNFVVLTSQNSELPSGPIVKDGKPINPFTYALAKMLAGDADGFTLDDGEPVQTSADGALTIGEMVDFVLHTTGNVPSDQERLRNTAKPTVGGSFDRGQILDLGRALLE